MNRFKSWFPGLLLVLVLGLIVFLLWPDDGPDLSRINADLLERETAGEFDPGQLQDLLSYRFQPGMMYRYSFNRRVHAAREKETFLDLSISGNLDIHAIDRQGRDLDLIVVLEVQQMGGIEGTADDASGLPYQNSVYLTVDAAGQPSAVRFPAAMRESERQQMLSDLAANFFKVLPEPGQAATGQILQGDSYSVQSRDTHGHYKASLRILTEENPVPLSMVKEKYIRSYTPVVVESSDQSIGWNALKGYPLVIESSEVLLVGPAEFQVRSTQSAEFFLTEVTDSRFSKDDLLAFTFLSDIYQDELQDLKSKELAAGAELSLDEARLRLASVQNQEEKEKHGTFRDLTVTFLRNPGTASVLIGEAGRFPSESDAFQMILGAASYAASMEAQQALRDLFRTNLDEFGRQSILEAFTLMDKPMGKESIDFLNGIFRERGELSTSAGLALGNALRQEENSEARSAIDAEWQRASNEAEKQTVLDFIGNSGEESFLPYLEAAMQGSVSLQRKAVYSARFMQGQRVRDFLLNALRSASDTGVREKAAAAIAFQGWDDGFMPALTGCVEKESATGLRIKCADAALGEVSRADAMRGVLARLAESGDADWQEYVQVQLRK